MDKREVDKLIKELNELSEFEKQNLERMKEIAHILVAYYMWWKKRRHSLYISTDDSEE